MPWRRRETWNATARAALTSAPGSSTIITGLIRDIMSRAHRTTLVASLLACLASVASAQTPPKPQVRPHGIRVAVPAMLLQIDDGDTVAIRWTDKDEEIVRILGIDAPETRHVEHNLPYAQPFGDEARAFARGAFASASRIELLRAAIVDPFGRTLGYLFIDGRLYSTMIVRARLAAESITQFGDNGFPKEAAEVLEAAKAQGPLPFEPPHVFRARMRELSNWLKTRGEYPDR
jgi:micrococcal nuclease